MIQVLLEYNSGGQCIYLLLLLTSPFLRALSPFTSLAFLPPILTPLREQTVCLYRR